MLTHPALETKFAPFTTDVTDAGKIEGYAAIFGQPDRGGDIIAPGAFRSSLANRSASVKLLWQHDPAQPIGLWDEISEDARGLRVSGRLLTGIRRGAEAAELLAVGALDGLSIGYRAVKADRSGPHRHLTEIDLWEISLVTFPMNAGARVKGPGDELAQALRSAADAFRYGPDPAETRKTLPIWGRLGGGPRHQNQPPHLQPTP